MTHDNHASGFGGGHGEDSRNRSCFIVQLISDYITDFGPARNYVIFLSRTVTCQEPWIDDCMCVLEHLSACERKEEFR